VERDEALGVERPSIPEAEHPVVVRHPDTGDEILYVSRGITRRIIGMERAESSALLKRLHLHATRPDQVYAHDWEVGDLIMFDTLGTMHRRDAWDPTQRRLMRQLSTACTV
jgi:alpha-ketoglutarate-dependent taurine dioxygenase